MAMVGPPSDCFDELKKDLDSQALPARFLPAAEAGALLDAMRARLDRGGDFCWSGFEKHGLRPDALLAKVAAWPGEELSVMLLDLVSERRVLRIRKDWLRAFFDEYGDPIAETYIASDDRRLVACIDHHELGHIAAVEPGGEGRSIE